MKTIVTIPIEVEILDANLPSGRRLAFLTPPRVIVGQVFDKAVEQIKAHVSDEAIHRWESDKIAP